MVTVAGKKWLFIAIPVGKLRRLSYGAESLRGTLSFRGRTVVLRYDLTRFVRVESKETFLLLYDRRDIPHRLEIPPG